MPLLRELTLLLKAQFPLLFAVRAVAEESTNKQQAECLLRIEHKLHSGYGLSQALRAHLPCLEDGFLHLIHLGQKYGILTVVLDSAIQAYDQQQAQRRALVKQCIYPMFVLIVALLVLVLLAQLVIPQLMQLIQNSKDSVPFMTRVIFAVAFFLQQYLWLWLGIFALTAVCIPILAHTHKVRRLWHYVLYALPALSQAQCNKDLAHLMDTMALLLERHVNITDVISSVCIVAQHPKHKAALKGMQQHIAQHASLAHAIGASDMLPKVHVRLIVQAEQSGSTASCFRHVAEVYKQKYQWQQTRMLLLLEPILVSIVSVFIGCILIGLYAPIFRIGGFAA